ncbi:hypothetical protein ACG74X_11220 [Marivita sp. S0852]|uniref:hypothetical protein n=1 Tax=Marivita sp. S0852 TaxID=3373893 RepID=UPI0039820CAA
MTDARLTTGLALCAALSGAVLRLADSVAPGWYVTAFAIIAIVLFGWIAVKTRFSSRRYTPAIWRVQWAAIAFVFGFNLTNWLEGFA